MGMMKTPKEQTLTKAQTRLMDRLQRDRAVPYEQRNAGTFRVHGRGIGRTLQALEKLGLVTYETVYGLTGTYFYAHPTDKKDISPAYVSSRVNISENRDSKGRFI